MPSPNARRAFAASLVAGFALAVPAAGAGSATAPSAGTERLVNGSFQRGLTGWRGYNARLTQARPGAVGARAARVTLSRRAASFSIYPARRPVVRTTRGAVYSGRALVRSPRPGRRLCLRIREWDGGRVVGAAQRCAPAATRWRALTVSYTAKGSGRSIDTYVYLWRARPGDAFLVDALTLRERLPAGAAQSASPAPVSPPAPGSPATPAPAPAPAPAAQGLAAAAVDHSRIRLEWSGVSGAASYRVLRGGLLLAATPALSFTDALLWPATRYEYTVEALGASGERLSSRSAAAATALLPAPGFPRPFAPSSFWNTPVGSRATHPRNADLSAYFRGAVRNPNITLRSWGVSVAEVRAGDPFQAVPCTRYRCSLDALGGVPIPLTARPDPSGDGHISIYDPGTLREWSMWQGKIASDGSWSASAGAAVSMLGAGLAPPNTGAGNAANFPNLGGIVRPEEILQGRIDHALVFGIPGIAKGPPVCPATHNAGTTDDPNALREGQLLQLDPAVDVGALPIPAWQKTIARAMQVYGMYLRDNSGSLAIYAESPHSRGYDPWSLLGLPSGNPSLAGIPWDRFRVLAAPDYPNC